jgi:hypothetical protein
MKTIPLVNGRGEAVVDDADYERLVGYVWSRDRWGYARRNEKRDGRWITILMHREILAVPAGHQTDHADGDTLNNRRSNLRVCTQSQNNANKRKCGGSSRYKGVSWNARQRQWVATIMVNRRAIFLGLYADEEPAARAYDAAALQHFGEFARTNFPKVGAA